ncbi:MAG: hypothetical protein MRY83_02475, partial [Flavobacteriales bacterium]|nr:hypothetical protein [Flavobacteriales bacterium]
MAKSKQKKKQNKPSEASEIKPSSALIKYTWLVYLLLAIFATYLAMSPSLKNEFTNWDDKGYVTENDDIKTFDKEKVKFFFEKNYY